MSSKWPTASKSNPCPVCGKDHNCKVAPDGTGAVCWHNGNGGKVIQLKEPEERPQRQREVAAYSYFDEQGVELYQAVRLEPGDKGKPKTFRQRRLDASGRVVWNTKGVRLVPFKLPELLLTKGKAEFTGQWRFVVEGEKDVDNLWRAGLIATCNVMGAGKWHDDYATPLLGDRVCVIADKDQPGRDHAQDVARSCHSRGITVVIIELPGGPVKDASDYLSAGGTAEQITALADAATPWTPAAALMATLPPKADDRPVFPDPVPLTSPPPPPLPNDLLPGWLGTMAREVANALEVPDAFASLQALAMMALATQGKFSVSPERGYFEPTNLYVACALPSGSRKSQTQALLLDPFATWERAKGAEHADIVKKLTARKQVIETKIKSAKAAAASAEPVDFEQAMKEVNELEETLPEIPVQPRLYTGDCTPEHLGTMLSQQNERLGVISDEGGFFDMLAGRYSSGVANLDLALQAFSNSMVRVDRGSRPSVNLNHPTLTIALTPQPDVLTQLGANRAFRGRGLLARFLYVVPESNLGFRTLVPCPVNDTTINTYRTYICTLLELPPRLKDERPVPYVLTLSSTAYDVWKAFQRDVEDLMKPQGRLDGMSDIGGKLPGQAARIAGLLHIAAHVSDITHAEVISVDTMTAAVTIARVCLEHALHVFGMMGLDDSLDIARRLWDEAVKLDAPAVSARDVWHPTRQKYPRIGDVDKGFDVLVERGWLVEQDDDRRQRGRPVKRKFLVNPKAIGLSGHSGHTFPNPAGAVRATA